MPDQVARRGGASRAPGVIGVRPAGSFRAIGGAFAAVPPPHSSNALYAYLLWRRGFFGAARVSTPAAPGSPRC